MPEASPQPGPLSCPTTAIFILIHSHLLGRYIWWDQEKTLLCDGFLPLEYHYPRDKIGPILNLFPEGPEDVILSAGLGILDCYRANQIAGMTVWLLPVEWC